MVSVEVGIVVIEDDHHISDLVAMYLRRDGFRVVQADDAERGLAAVARESPRLVVLDLGLPGELDGLDVCRRLAAATPPVPVLILSARDDEVDRILGLELGADDYVPKPFRLRELVARMRAVLRRAPGGSESGELGGSIEFGTDGIWESNGIKVDFDQRRVFVRGEEVHLRRKEFELLRLLVENSGRVLTRDVLIDRVWGTDYIGDTKTLDVHIKRLRSRIEADPSTPVLITTVRGVGYRFAAV